jgi:hypothetical protein
MSRADVMPRVVLMENMNQEVLFERSKIFFHLATLDNGTAPLFERLAVSYWMKAVALDGPDEDPADDQAQLLRRPRRDVPSERTAA